MRRTAIRAVVAAVGLFNLVVGVWAFAAPRSFFDTLATFPPFNEHLFHDLGAFQGALGVALLVALWVRDGLVVAVVANLTGAVAHFVSHVMDADLGGRSTDPLALGVLAAALLFALLLYEDHRDAASASEPRS